MLPHVGFSDGFEDRHMAVPVFLHADKGEFSNRDKILCISWGSAASRAETIHSNLLFSVLPAEWIVKHETEEMLYAVWVWSMFWLMEGIFPDVDHNGDPWPAGSRRAALAGLPLADGYRCLFAEFRGDWEWVVDTFGFRRDSLLLGWSGCFRCHVEAVTIQRLHATILQRDAFIGSVLAESI